MSIDFSQRFQGQDQPVQEQSEEQQERIMRAAQRLRDVGQAGQIVYYDPSQAPPIYRQGQDPFGGASPPPIDRAQHQSIYSGAFIDAAAYAISQPRGGVVGKESINALALGKAIKTVRGALGRFTKNDILDMSSQLEIERPHDIRENKIRNQVVELTLRGHPDRDIVDYIIGQGF